MSRIDIPAGDGATLGTRREFRVRSPRLTHVPGAAIALPIVLVLFFGSVGFGAETARQETGTRWATALQPFATSVPLVVARESDGGIEVRRVGLKWSPSSPAAPEAIRIAVHGPGADEGQVVESQAWIAAFSAAFVWQMPWQGAAWEISQAPASDGSAVDAGLAVAMIASASGTPYPADTAVIADLSPDSSLAPVPRMLERIEAAAAAGLKRVVIPSIQIFALGPDGKTVDLAARAERLGLACIPAATLAEATERLLGFRAAPLPEAELPPRVDGAVFRQLEGECQTLLAGLEKEKAVWPIDAERRAALPLWQRALWVEALSRFANGVSLLREGKVYAARSELGETQALVYALASLSADLPAVPQLSADATLLAADYRAALARVSDRREELENGLVMAEMADWAGGVVADLDGAQNLVYQTSGRHSDALPEQREMAHLQLAVAVRKAQAKRERFASFAALHRILVARNTVDVYDRAALWRPQLLPAHLALGEAFVLRLQKADPQLAQNLIYDARLTEQTRLLRDRKEEWDNRRSAEASLVPAVARDAQAVGFSPGKAYRPPRAEALPSIGPAAASDTEATLRWVNDYTEMAALYDCYFQFGGSYHPQEMGWTFEDRAVLSGMLQNAEAAARRGVAAARETGADPTVLELIYERACALRDSRLDTSRMEALRQFWRCNLLGATAWQLAAIPKAQGLPAPAAPEKAAPAAGDADGEKVSPAQALAREEIDHDEVRRATVILTAE